jgi:hypothetical protein
MFEAALTQSHDDINVEIARHEVSEDGVNWRPYDPTRDAGHTLHKRIEFAPPAANES